MAGENGYIIKQHFLNDIDKNGNKIWDDEVVVVEEKDDENKTLIEVLYVIAEKLGFTYNKYGENNLNITFDKKGHKL